MDIQSNFKESYNNIVDKDSYQLPNRPYESPSINSSLLLKDNFSNYEKIIDRQNISIIDKNDIADNIVKKKTIIQNETIEHKSIENKLNIEENPLKQELEEPEEVLDS